MHCGRCDRDVPDFLWNDGDHPVLLEHPMTVHTNQLEGDLNQVKVTAHIYVEKRLCSELPPITKNVLNLSHNMAIEEAVAIAMGYASNCWDNLDYAGVFQSERCAKASKELVEYFQSKGPIY